MSMEPQLSRPELEPSANGLEPRLPGGEAYLTCRELISRWLGSGIPAWRNRVPDDEWLEELRLDCGRRTLVDWWACTARADLMLPLLPIGEDFSNARFEIGQVKAAIAALLLTHFPAESGQPHPHPAPLRALIEVMLQRPNSFTPSPFDEPGWRGKLSSLMRRLRRGCKPIAPGAFLSPPTAEWAARLPVLRPMSEDRLRGAWACLHNNAALHSRVRVGNDALLECVFEAVHTCVSGSTDRENVRSELNRLAADRVRCVFPDPRQVVSRKVAECSDGVPFFRSVPVAK
jgi:hypothetical protein